MKLKSVRRSPSPGTVNPPLLILLHGLASDENDLFGLSPELDPRLLILSLRAPYETGYGGFAWFGIEFLSNGERLIDEAQALSSCHLLEEEIDSIVAAESPSKIILAGFSQGAMMSAGVLMRSPSLVDGVWLMSGRYIPSLDLGDHSQPSRPVLVQHGLYDEVLPIADGERLAEVLGAKGHDVAFKKYPMAHQVSHESLQDAKAWLRNFTDVRSVSE